MENAEYLFAAFSVTWAFVFGYLFLLFNRQKRLKQEIELIKGILKEKERK